MENITMTVKGDKLHIEVDLNTSLGPSKSGKTIVIGSTKGAIQIPDYPGTMANINIYKYPESK